MKKCIFPLVLLILLFTVTPVLAQSNRGPGSVREEPKELRKQIGNEGKNFLDRTKEMVASKEGERKDRLEMLDQKIAWKEADFRKKFEDKMKEMVSKRASKEAELQNKLNLFKDKRKAEVAKRVDVNLNKINTNRTNEMAKRLDQMATVSLKLQTRVASASADGKNTASAAAAIASANSAIEAARLAVTTQAGKDYTVPVSTESAVFQDVQKVRNALFTDLTATHDLVKAAKQSLVNAVKAVVALGGTNE